MTALARAFRSAVLRAPGGNPEGVAVPAPAAGSAERWGRVAVGAALALCALGVLMVYSSSSVRAATDSGDGMFYLKRQLAWAAIGLAAMVVCMRVPLSFWRANARPLFVLSIALLAAVLVVGANINGGKRWFRFGSLSFQPSELAKLSCLLFVSAWLCDRRDELHDFRRGFLPAAGAVGLMTVLILVEPDFGTALFVGSLGAALLITGGIRMKHMLFLGACALPILGWSVWTRLETIKERFQFMGGADNAHYQVKQGLVALGSGGIVGRGPGAGTAKLFFLPEASSDFILPMLGEELGFVGTLLVVLLYAAFVRAGARVCLRCIDRDPFAFYVSLGATLWVGLQACINIAVTTACAPTKGIALPFVSLGGSGLVTLMAATGILYAAARRADDAALALEGRVS